MAVYINFDVPAGLANSAVEALEIARDTGIVKKGANETTESIEWGNARLVLIAEDVSPEEIVMHLLGLADKKSIPFIFVETRDDISHAAGLEVGSATTAIVDAGDAPGGAKDIATRVEGFR